VQPIQIFTLRALLLRKLERLQESSKIKVIVKYLLFLVSYRLGLFPMIDPELSVHVDLVHGHYADDLVVETRVEDKARVTGHSVHVLVDPITNKPVPFSEEWREKFTPASPRLSL